jgi:hypothetical protein
MRFERQRNDLLHVPAQIDTHTDIHASFTSDIANTTHERFGFHRGRTVGCIERQYIGNSPKMNQRQRNIQSLG